MRHSTEGHSTEAIGGNPRRSSEALVHALEGPRRRSGAINGQSEALVHGTHLRVHVGTGAMAPPGADTLTSSAPSAVGPRDDHVYCRSAAILERSEYCGCPICDETKAPTAIEQPEVPDEGRNQTCSDALGRNQRLSAPGVS